MSVTDFATHHATFRAEVKSALDTFIAGHSGHLADISPDTRAAVTALSDFLASGKRFRPAFCYWGHIGAGGEAAPAIVIASAALELLQAAALIHDDVMDRSDTRRGQPAVHRRFEALHRAEGMQGDSEQFGLAGAILAGDLALVWTDVMLYTAGFDAASLARGKQVLDDMRTELMAGQYLDVFEQARGGGDVDRALRVIRYKTTAYTIERPLHLGAALAGASPEVLAAYSAFAVPLGEAFQLRDDLLGVFGDPEETGKPAGDDLREGKRTVLLAIARARATAADQRELDALVGNADLDEAGVERVRGIFEQTGALAHVEQRISTNLDAALAALDSPAITRDGAAMLHQIAIAATDRTA